MSRLLDGHNGESVIKFLRITSWVAFTMMIAMIVVAVVGDGTDLVMLPVFGIWGTLALIGAEILSRMDKRP